MWTKFYSCEKWVLHFGTTYPTSTEIRFGCMAHATIKKWERSSLFSDAGAISKFRQEEPMIIWMISSDRTCFGRLSMAKSTLYLNGEKRV
jgi:hypothetical protein